MPQVKQRTCLFGINYLKVVTDLYALKRAHIIRHESGNIRKCTLSLRSNIYHDEKYNIGL
jgi:hypothetical protein